MDKVERRRTRFTGNETSDRVLDRTVAELDDSLHQQEPDGGDNATEPDTDTSAADITDADAATQAEEADPTADPQPGTEPPPTGDDTTPAGEASTDGGATSDGDGTPDGETKPDGDEKKTEAEPPKPPLRQTRLTTRTGMQRAFPVVVDHHQQVRFNRKGEAVRISATADLRGVEWLATKIGRRLHAVAGGWCGRHIARACPKNAADGCYSCDDFQTEPGLLHIHQDTLARTLELQQTAEAAGRVRVAERNKRVATAIQHLIDRVHQDEAEAAGGSAVAAPADKELVVDAS